VFDAAESREKSRTVRADQRGRGAPRVRTTIATCSRSVERD